jgi:predicted Zn finger-like uncharacterized protein
MLFTRCPACKTTFRITAETLRIASGKVRCGNCASVFSAYSGLRQETGFRPAPDEDVFSQTIQTRELANIEELEGPEDWQDDLGSGEFEPAAEEPPHEESVAQAVEDSTKDAANADEIAAPVATGEPDSELRFEHAGDDEWLQVLEEIQAGDDTADDEAEQEETPAEVEEAEVMTSDDEQILEFGSKVGAEFDPDDLWALSHENVADLIDYPGDGDAAVAHAAAFVVMSVPEFEAPTVEQAALAREPIEELEFEPGVDETISAEEVDATLSADTEPELLAALAAASDAARKPPLRPRVWGLGSALLLLLLAAQAVHSYRAPLASRSVVGPVLRSAYGILGMELIPRWDLAQYEVLDLSATAASGVGVSSLRITARIRNNGPRAQPYPAILLELKDRWEAVVGSRVFEPAEYLAGDVAKTDTMAAGAIVPAELAVVDPGNDAYGFELDVCVPASTARLRCANDQVFK